MFVFIPAPVSSDYHIVYAGHIIADFCYDPNGGALTFKQELPIDLIMEVCSECRKFTAKKVAEKKVAEKQIAEKGK